MKKINLFFIIGDLSDYIQQFNVTVLFAYSCDLIFQLLFHCWQPLLIYIVVSPREKLYIYINIYFIN